LTRPIRVRRGPDHTELPFSRLGVLSCSHGRRCALGSGNRCALRAGRSIAWSRLGSTARARQINLILARCPVAVVRRGSPVPAWPRQCRRRRYGATDSASSERVATDRSRPLTAGANRGRAILCARDGALATAFGDLVRDGRYRRNFGTIMGRMGVRQCPVLHDCDDHWSALRVILHAGRAATCRPAGSLRVSGS
jgi:hypothetical protein